MPIILGKDDVDEGLKQVAAEMADGRVGFWVGRGPAGFAFIVGARERHEVAGGVAIGVSMTEKQFRGFVSRALELLGSEAQSGVGLVGRDG